MAFDAGAIEATLTLNRNPFTAGLAAAKQQAESFERRGISLPVTAKLDRSSLRVVKEQIAAVAATINANVKLDRSSLQTVKAQIDKVVGSISVKVELDRSSLSALQARLNSLHVTIPVDLNLRAGEIARLRAALAASRFSVPVNVNVQGGGLQNVSSQFEQAAGSASHFQSILALIIGTLPLMSSALIAATGVLGAIGSAFGIAAAGAGAFALVGVSMFSKINDATKANTTAIKQNASGMKAAENARQSLVRAQENAAESTVRANRRVEDAERSLERTYESAADSKVQANRRVSDAERALQSAQERSKYSQEALNDARKQAVEELEDLKLALRGGALSEEQAVLNLERAQHRYNVALKLGMSGNEIKQLELDVRQAALAVDEAKEHFGDLQEESAKWAKTGIEGSKGVVDAQKDLKDANAAVADAERNVAEARADADKAAKNSAREIADAQRNLKEAQDDAAQQQRENLRAIADATKDLQMAQESQTASAIDGAVKLTAAQQLAANALKRLKDAYNDLVNRTEGAVSKAFIANFDAWSVAIRTLDGIIISAAGAFEHIGNLQKKYFAGSEWKTFTDFIAKTTGPTLEKLFLILAYGVQSVMNLIMAFQPLTDWMLDALVRGMKGLAEWTSKLQGNPAFVDFINRVKQALPALLDLFGNLIEFVWKLAVGLEPLGTLIFKVLTQIFDGLNKLPPEWLAAIALGIASIWAAFALGAGGPVSIALGVLVGLGTIFTNLYEKNETFRNSINGLVDDLKAKWQPIWDIVVKNFNDKILPAWNELARITRDELIPKLREFGGVIEKEVWPKIAPLVDTITGTLIPAFLGFLGALIRIVGFLIDVFGPTVAKELGAAFTVFDGTFRAIAGLLNIFTGTFTGDWKTFNAGIVQLTEGFWTIIAGMFGTNLAGLREQVQAWDRDIDATWTAFWNGVVAFLRSIWDTIGLVFRAALDIMHGDVSSAADKIGQVWRKIANLFAAPINWVINTVIGPPGGIAGAWNTVMSWIGAPGLNVQRPQNIPAFAGGGQVRGKGSGTSDDNLALVSNGEFVVRESVARHVTPFLNALNGGQAEALRAASADKSVDDMMMRFAAGGVVGGQSVLNTMRGRPYIWGGGSAAGTDCSGLVAYVQRGMAGEANPYRRIGTTSSMPWGGWVGGLTSALTAGVNGRGGGASHMAGTLAGTNFEARQTGIPIMVGGPARGSGSFPYQYSLSSAGGQYVGGGAGGEAAQVSWWSLVSDKVSSLLNGLLNFGGMPGNGSPIGNAITSIPKALVGKTTDALKSKLSAMMTSVFGGGGIGSAVSGGAIGDILSRTASQFGWGSGAAMDAIRWIVNKESGGNPNAQNPTSSAYGLFQLLNGTWGGTGVGKSSDPGQQALAGMRYIQQRYGSPQAAQSFWQSHGYYDNGGELPPGATAAFNGLGEPEAVLTGPQWDAVMTKKDPDIATIVEEVLRSLGVGGSGSGDTYNVMLPERATVRELADTIDFKRKVVAKGRYAR